MTEKKVRSMTKQELLDFFEQQQHLFNELKEIKGSFDNGNLLNVAKEHTKKIAEYASNVSDLHDAFFVGDDNEESQRDEIERLHKEVKKSHEEISTAKINILGRNLVKDTGEIAGRELGYIDHFEDHKKTVEALIKQVEGLLPSATTIGLAKGFSDKANYYKNSRRIWEVTQTAFLISGVAVSAYFFWKYPIPTEIKEIIFYYVRTFSVVAIFVWLVIFMGNRRAENRKLEESYKHKESMAMSFVGYKKSIRDLRDDEELLAMQMRDLLGAIKKDASEHLSTKGEGPPAADLIKNTKNN